MKDCITMFLPLQVEDSCSRRNTHEGDFLIALCRYLVQQGYSPGRITVLAAYAGQMFYLQKVSVHHVFWCPSILSYISWCYSVDHVFWCPGMRSCLSWCYSIRPYTARPHIHIVSYYSFLQDPIFIPSKHISIPFHSLPMWFIHFICVPCFFCQSLIKPRSCLKRPL